MTHRWTNPHVRVDVLAVEQSPVTTALRCAELILVAPVNLGITVISTILFTRSLRIHVYLIDDVSLEDLLQLGVCCFFNDKKEIKLIMSTLKLVKERIPTRLVLCRIALPKVSRRKDHGRLDRPQSFRRPDGVLLFQLFHFLCEIACRRKRMSLITLSSFMQNIVTKKNSETSPML